MITKANFTKFLANTGNEVRREYNRVVTNFALTGINEASNQLIIAITTTGYVGSKEQKMMINTVFDLLSLQESAPVVADYKPKFPKGLNFWAIDSDGEAYYYSENPDRGRLWWTTPGISKLDSDFDSYTFSHLWEDGKWKESLAQSSVKNYTPVFPEWASFWAIDKNGNAYFYEDYPTLGSFMWCSDEDYANDTDFCAEEFPTMWKDGMWEKSLIVG